MDKKQSRRLPNNIKVEIGLKECQIKQNHKFNILNSKKIEAQLVNNKASPAINSRHLKTKSNPDIISSPTRLKRTHAILKSTNFMPKKVKISISSLKSTPISYKILSRNIIRYDKLLSSPCLEDPITFPSLPSPTACTANCVPDIPVEISKRNNLILSLKTQEPLEPKPKTENLSFEERSKLWFNKKCEKLKLLKEKNETLETECCTFRPTFNSPSLSKLASSREHLSKSGEASRDCEKRIPKISAGSSVKSRFEVVENEKNVSADAERVVSVIGSVQEKKEILCPVSMSVSYFSGYSNSLKSKFKPLISYDVLNVRT